MYAMHLRIVGEVASPTEFFNTIGRKRKGGYKLFWADYATVRLGEGDPISCRCGDWLL